jgi:hypothetical protein
MSISSSGIRQHSTDKASLLACCYGLFQSLCLLLHATLCRITEDGIQQLAALSNLSSLAYGYTSMIEADYVAELVASQFPSLTGTVLAKEQVTMTAAINSGHRHCFLLHLRLLVLRNCNCLLHSPGQGQLTVSCKPCCMHHWSAVAH